MLLEELTLARGISGDESEVRNIIKAELKNYSIDTFADNMGNLFAEKKIDEESVKVLITAHMDEVGLIITMINDNGTLKFKTVGSIDERILASKRFFIGPKLVPGVIGTKPVHLLEDDEKKRPLTVKSLYIDIGCSSKKEAEKLIEPGDYAYFDGSFVEMENRLVKSKAVDNRVGCNIIIDVLKESYNINLQACFSVQEEIGARGSGPAVRRLKPDYAIVIEGTTCMDVPHTEERNIVARLNNGPTISIIDKSTAADKRLFEFVSETAKKCGIKFQIKEGIYGRNDSGSIQPSEGGIPTIVISVPCRYIHSPNSVMSLYDYDETVKLIKAILRELTR